MSLVVDEAHLGTPEAEWLGSGVLDALPTWAPPATGRVVVVAPHPDDEVLGAGGLVRLLSLAGAAVHLIAVTDGDGSHPSSPTVTPAQLAGRRRAETAEALRRLGVPLAGVRRLGLLDGHVAASEDLVAEAVADAAAGGGLVVAPWAEDGHRDHDASGRAARRAVASGGGLLVEYLVWAWHWATPAGGELPLGLAGRVPLDRRTRAAKRWATAAYRSQIRPLSPAVGDEVVLPAAVVRRAWRPFEVVIPGVQGG